jgi:hypothetical protein
MVLPLELLLLCCLNALIPISRARVHTHFFTHSHCVKVGWLRLTGTPQCVRRIRGADMKCQSYYLIVLQCTTGGQYPLKGLAPKAPRSRNE